MRCLIIALLALVLSGCSLFAITPVPPPPPGPNAQEVTRAQSVNLPRLGTRSVTVRGSPDDAARALAAKANAVGARYYYIQLIDETVAPGLWYASAIFYGSAAKQ